MWSTFYERVRRAPEAILIGVAPSGSLLRATSQQAESTGVTDLRPTWAIDYSAQIIYLVTILAAVAIFWLRYGAR